MHKLLSPNSFLYSDHTSIKTFECKCDPTTATILILQSIRTRWRYGSPDPSPSEFSLVLHLIEERSKTSSIQLTHFSGWYLISQYETVLTFSTIQHPTEFYFIYKKEKGVTWLTMGWRGMNLPPVFCMDWIVWRWRGWPGALVGVLLSFILLGLNQLLQNVVD